jgi:hypothetical protein
MTYADMAAIMLGAVAVIVTVLGVFIAILAVWGYSQFRNMATSAASSHIDAQIKDGQLKVQIETVINAYLDKELSSAGNLRKIIEERADFVVYSSAEQRAKAVEAEQVDEESEYGEYKTK